MTSSPAKTERRKKLRKKPLRLVYVELAFGNGGMMRDLSEEGFAVRAMMPVKKGDKTTFSFTLGDTTRIEGEGKVLWVGEGGRVAGVEFVTISPGMKTQIDDWLIEEEKVESPREAAAKEPAFAPASTIEELKEELRSTPARTESAPEEIAEQPQAIAAESEIETTSAIVPPETKPEIEIVPTEERVVPTVQATSEAELKPVPRLPAIAPPSEPAVEPVPSVAEGFFRKWPKDPPPAPRIESRIPRAPQVVLPAEPESRAVEQEEEVEVTQAEPGPLLPDISEILIQPHASSPGARALPELPEIPRAGSRNREWFTLRRAVLCMLALTVLAGVFVFHRAVGRGLIWLGEAMGGTSANSPAANGEGVDNVPVAGDADLAQSAKPGTGAENPANAPSGRSASKPAVPPVTPLAGISSSAPPESSSDSGQMEYTQAVQLLRGRNSGADTQEAVRLLWIAVEKGHPAAELALADLYWHGRGVAKNCDQTRILLTAAARKGSGEAQKRLQQFQQQGCE